MFTASMPSSVRSAVWKHLKHCDARTFFFNETMVLLDYVVQVFTAPQLAVERDNPLLL
jgi:hypothetical protein